MSTLQDKRTAAAVAVVEPPGELSILNLIAEAARDDRIPVEKLVRLVALQREIVADERRVAFYSAMAKVQAEIRAVLRDAENKTTDSRYATYEARDRAIRPVYTAHGFSVMNDSTTVGNVVVVSCRVTLGGHSETVTTEVPFDLTGPKGNQNKSATHAWKSAITYGRGVALDMAFNLAATNRDDDDGNAAGDTGEVISPAQHAHLYRLGKDSGMDAGQFLQRFAPYARTLADIRVVDFQKCVTGLETRRRSNVRETV